MPNDGASSPPVTSRVAHGAGDLEKLRQRVVMAAEAALADQHNVSAIDVLTGIGWLDVSWLKRWRLSQVPYLEQAIPTNPRRLSEAWRMFRIWAEERGLVPSETTYVSRTPERSELRFTASGNAAMEQFYRTHWVSPDLSEKKLQRVHEQANRPPELVVIEPLHREWKCHRCGGTGDLLTMEPPGPSCLKCAGLGSLEFLPAGDAALSRRAKARSKRSAVVVRFSRARKRYERQGLLVEPEALSATDPHTRPRTVQSRGRDRETARRAR